MIPGVEDPGLRPFSQSGYEILDEDLASRGLVVIWSVSTVVPQEGDLFTVESGGRMYDVTVDELTTHKGGWTAQCKIFGLAA